MRLLSIVALALTWTACSVAPPTTTVGPSGGTVLSRDGRFWLEIPPGALDREVELHIAIRADLQAEALASAVYEVSPSDLVLALPATARYLADTGPWIGRRALARFHEGALVDLLGATYDRERHTIGGAVGVLEPSRFAMALRIEPASCTDVSCGTPCGSCDPRDPACMGDPDGPRCGVGGACAEPEASCPADGWNAPPGTGLAFVINTFAIADEGRGFDLDGKCRGDHDCIDNALFRLGQLGNDQIRQSLLGGESLIVVELAGVDGPLNDGALTVKWYTARDFDDPIFPANNFSVPSGERECCAFVIGSASMRGDPANARARFDARMGRGLIEGTAVEGPAIGIGGVWPTFGSTTTAPHFVLRRARLTMRLPTPHEELVDGLMGGMVRARDLALAPSTPCGPEVPLCSGPSSARTMLDRMLVLAQPDLDDDGDGLERLIVGPDGLIAECIDGNGGRVPSPEPSEPWRCAEDPRIADGYSVSYTFSAVRASIRGVQ